jgi:hypothetical protein
MAVTSLQALSTMSFNPENSFEGKDCECVLQFLEDCVSPMVSDLLKLLCCLGGIDIPVNMLLRGNSPRRIWGSDGEIEERNEPALHIIDLIDKKTLEKSIQPLGYYGLLVKEDVASLQRTLSIDPSMLKSMQRLVPSWPYWQIQATVLACHTFPRDRDLGVS